MTLVERLREGEWTKTVVQGPNPTAFTTDVTATIREAATTIETQAAEIERLTAAIERLGSSEAMTVACSIDHKTRTGKELVARMEYARASLQSTDREG